MKNLVKKMFESILLFAVILSSFVISNATPSEKQNFLGAITKRENSVLKNAKVALKNNDSAGVKKSHSRAAPPRKVTSLRKNNLKAVEKSKGCYFRLEEPGAGCFTECLARNADPDVVASCADACGRGDWISCGACIGVGITIVAGCAYECGKTVQ
jgi:hypothetical protein